MLLHGFTMKKTWFFSLKFQSYCYSLCVLGCSGIENNHVAIYISCANDRKQLSRYQAYSGSVVRERLVLRTFWALLCCFPRGVSTSGSTSGGRAPNYVGDPFQGFCIPTGAFSCSTEQESGVILSTYNLVNLLSWTSDIADKWESSSAEYLNSFLFSRVLTHMLNL